MMNSVTRILLAGSFIVGLIIVHASGLADLITLAQIKKDLHFLVLQVEQHYLLSLVVFILVFLVAVLASLPVTVLLTVLSGYLFGVLPGALVSTVAATAGSGLIFLVVRHLIGTAVQKRFQPYLIELNKELDLFGAWYVLIAQLLPITPTPLINLCAGLTRISLFTFLWTNFLGMLPGSLVYAYFGQQIEHVATVNELFSWPMIILLTVFAGLLFVSVAIKRHLQEC